MRDFIGASQGWFVAKNTKDDTLLLTDLHKPWVSSPRVISLPSPGVIFSSMFLSNWTKVSLSSPDPVLENDFSVAAKFNDNQLSVCKPCRDGSTWTHIEVPHSENLMYSKRDETFYFTASQGLFNLTNNNELKYKALRLRNEPRTSEDYWYMLKECYRTEHLVESPSGEPFFIKWYTKCHYVHEVCGSYKIRHIRPQRFMVFREKEKRSNDFCYTEDIGDLCIFLGKSEAFCLSASMYPGLKPNSIYYTGPISDYHIFKPVGLYDLASGTIRSFRPCDYTNFSDGRYWLHPTNPKGTEIGTYVASCSDIDDSYLHRFQSIRALHVEDLIKPEPCEETWNEERKVTKAMEPGQGREEVVEKVTKEFTKDLNEEEVVEKVTKKFSKLEELEEEVNEKVTKTFSYYSGELEEVVAKKVTKKFRGNKELEEEVVENITRTFSKFEELEEEIAEKVTQKFRGKEELEEELVEKIKKIFSEMEITKEVVEKVTKKFSKFKKRGVEPEITEEVAEKITKVFLPTPDDYHLDEFLSQNL